MFEQLPPDAWGVGGAGTIVGGALVYVARAIVTLAKRVSQFIDKLEEHQSNESAHWQREEAFFAELRRKTGPQGVVPQHVPRSTTPIVEVVSRDMPPSFGFHDGEG